MIAEKGLWVRSTGLFYVLEMGYNPVRSPVDRIKRTLIARGHIKYDITGTKRNEEPYKIFTLGEAKEKGYEQEVLYLNSHVRKVVQAEATKVKETPANAWK